MEDSERAPRPIRRVALATDPAADAPQLVADALGLALRAGAELELVHVYEAGHPEAAWRALPGVRDLLERWGVLAADDGPDALDRARVRFHALDRARLDGDLVGAVSRAVGELAPDLLVLGTSARAGLERVVRGSVAEEVVRDVHRASLVVPRRARALVDAATGALRIRRVLVPVTADVPQQPVIDALHRLLAAVATEPVAFALVHVGAHARLPDLRLPARTDWTWRTETRRGALVDEILAAAEAHDADLVAMASEGHDSLLDTVRGSVTERVLRRSPFPLLCVGAR